MSLEPVRRPDGLRVRACGSWAGDHRWGDEELFLVNECLRVSGVRPPVSLLGDHGCLGDMALGFRVGPVSFSTGPVGASPGWGRHRVLWWDKEQVLAAKYSASETQLLCVTSVG